MLLKKRTSVQNLSPKGILTPVIKWAGGKTKLLPHLVALAPKRFRRYYEPFAGGAALFLHLEPEQATLADTNADLISMYRCLADLPDQVLRILDAHKLAHNEDHYYETRDIWNAKLNASPSEAWRAAAFIYLNKTCFNGLWRVNAKGEFNTPMGDYANPKIYDEAHLRAVGQVMSRTALRIEDYRTTVAQAEEGDFVYFDPPYIPASPTASFTAYTSEGFGEVQQHELAMHFRNLATRGVQVMLSNSDTPLARHLYKDFQIHAVSRQGTMNSDSSKRGRVGEIIVRAGYRE